MGSSSWLPRIAIFFSAALLGSREARADVLFIDVNSSPQEVEAARRAATARRETLHVIPGPLTPAEIVQREALTARRREISNQMRGLHGGSGNTRHPVTGRPVNNGNRGNSSVRAAASSRREELAHLDQE